MISKTSGVDPERAEHGLRRMISHVGKTLAIRPGIGKAQLGFGFFANVIDVGNGKGLAISTDGVGTKILVAQMMERYDTVGIDCVAMNVNDVLCVGAEPLTMVDCITVDEVNGDLLEELGKGLYLGCADAGINLVGGELAQINEMIKGIRSGDCFDLIGTCVGLVDLNRILDGSAIKAGDVVVGLDSSGVHSNGFTLARKVLFENAGYRVDAYVPELGRTLGDELLQPTLVYASAVMEMLGRNLEIHGMAHITGGGLLNIARLQAEVGYNLDSLPEPQPIFDLIRSAGSVSYPEMFETFNMGIGYCLVVSNRHAAQVVKLAATNGIKAATIGQVVEDSRRRILIEQHNLVGIDGRFEEID